MKKNTNPITKMLCEISLLILLLFFLFQPCLADQGKTGLDIMDEVFKRHELFPYVYEEQTMIMTDSAGNQDVRKARQFLRKETDKTIKYLLVFDNPAEIRGVALRVIRPPDDPVKNGVYLPAFGKEFTTGGHKSYGNHILGTDFALEDLIKNLSDFQYVRQADQRLAMTDCFVVDAFPGNDEIKQYSSYSMRRHFIRQDNFCIIRTDFYDRRGRFFKRLTRHDLKKLNQNMWRANMILMENFRESHTTLIKIDSRIFSRDYVLPQMFTKSWLQENRHIQESKNYFFSKVFGHSKEAIPLEPLKETLENKTDKPIGN
ncbi:MAG: outer membrane lipoprotein-sorting protein [Pseudomonadota bacterium]